MIKRRRIRKVRGNSALLYTQQINQIHILCPCPSVPSSSHYFHHHLKEVSPFYVTILKYRNQASYPYLPANATDPHVLSLVVAGLFPTRVNLINITLLINKSHQSSVRYMFLNLSSRYLLLASSFSLIVHFSRHKYPEYNC
jgi:hypothetical protein